MTASAVPVPNVDAMHAHFVEWVWYLDAKDVELTTQQAKLDAKKVKTRNAVPANPQPSGSLETTCGMDFLDHVFRPQTSDLEIAASQGQAEHAPEEVTSQDDFPQVTEGFESPKVEALGSGDTVTSPMISPVEDDELV
jgi:hypothetical protein